MIDPIWIVCGLALFDVVVLFAFFTILRSHPALDRKTRLVIAIGLSGFVFHALVFFSGAILYLQLATMATIYFVLMISPFKRRSGRPTP